MRLICPSCDARYEVPVGLIGEKGREVRCTNCDHLWYVPPPPMFPILEAPASPPRAVGEDAETGAEVAEAQVVPDPTDSGRTAEPVEPAQTAEVSEVGKPAEAPDAGDSVEAAKVPEVAQPVEPAKAPQVAEPAETVESAKVPEPVEPAKSVKTAVPGGDVRGRQLAEIRAMLTEVQAQDPERRKRKGPDADADDPPPPVSAGRVGSVPPPLSSAQQSLQAERDPGAAGPGGADKGQPASSDAPALAERTQKRRRRKAAARSGAFMTGVLLAAILAAVMITLYMLHPQIIARLPGTEAALTQYVATIDSLRVSLAQMFDRQQQ